MKRKLTLWVNDEEKRVLMQALRMHQQSLVSAITNTEFQREIIRLELGITTELLDKVERQEMQGTLPTILKLSGMSKFNDWKQDFCELQKGATTAIIACGTSGERITVNYDSIDQAFSIVVDGILEMKNQHMGFVLRRFKELVKE
ncbi:hypothetical protein SAMN05444392_11142 [Seinonella peptonophila]|uniref:Uncharacterized protein n=1 Tax=Seinonella peptonophila TaxID=112248 RepID=A0A1M4ZXX3_9BACL|nr:hypothetical protein [Seinonella peptonophila]SHF22923.1 hypothetical protein SAMN05444392_11142 [Seinonella peptonophila]